MATPNPFDPGTFLFAKHAQHVVLIHFPIALFTIGVLFDLAGQWTKRVSLAEAAYYNFLVAAGSTVPVLVTGVLAWRFALDGQRLRGTLLLHLLFGSASALFIWLAWLAHYRARQRNHAAPVYRWPVELIGVVLVSLTGHLGGFLSGVNGGI
jgi:uncharacterized membrane protein